MFFIAFCLLYNQRRRPPLQCVHTQSPSLVWLYEPMDYALSASSVHGVLQARILECPPPGDLPDPGIEPMSLASPALQFRSVQLLSRVWLLATPWTAAHQASLSITNSRSLLKLMSIMLVMPSNLLILCHPLLLLPSIFPSIRVFSNESALHNRWPKYWSFSFNISPSNEHPGLISFRIDWLDLLAVQGTQESSPTPQFKSINSLAFSFPYSPTLTSIHDHWKNHSLD